MKMIRGFQVRYVGPNKQFKVGRRWYGKDEVVRASFPEARRAAHMDKHVVIERWRESVAGARAAQIIADDIEEVDEVEQPQQPAGDPVPAADGDDDDDDEFSLEDADAPAGGLEVPTIIDAIRAAAPHLNDAGILAISNVVGDGTGPVTVEQLTEVNGVGRKTAEKILAALDALRG